MTTQLCSRGKVPVFRVGISAVALLLVLVVRERAMATPVLAQAYGTACHTQTPMLNAFGRYIRDDDGAAVLAEVNGAGQGRLPNIDVALHNYALDHVGGRSGTKFGNANGESPFGEEHDYPRGADRPLPWRVAYVDPGKQYEVGVFGETGAPGFTGSTSFGCGYATAPDSNPGYLSPHVAANPIQPAFATVSSWRIGSASQMAEHDHGTVNFTYYQTNQALGEIGVRRLIPPNGTQTGGGPGFSYAIDRYTRFYTTVSLQNQRPALSILMQFK
jgi:hypothetical protein